MVMKTRIISLFAVGGMLMASGFAAPAVDTPPAQPQPSVTDSATAPTSGAPQFSGRIDEVVTLAKSGVDQSVVLSYIHNSPGPFEPTADEIIKLRDMGITSQEITAMLERGGELREQAQAAAANAAQRAVSPAQAPMISDAQPDTEAVQTPPNSYVGTDYGTDYGYQPGSQVVFIGGSSYPVFFNSGFVPFPFFYPFPCWFHGVFFPRGCLFPHGGFVNDRFHVHDGFRGFHGGGFVGHSGFHSGGFIGGGFRGGVSGGFHSGAIGGFHGSVGGFRGNVGGFHGNIGGFRGGMSFHGGSIGGGFHGSIGGGARMGGGGFHMGGGGGGFHGGGRR